MEIPPIDIGNEPVKDVVVETTTLLFYEDGKSNEKNYTPLPNGQNFKGYTFISSRVKPEVGYTVPDEIHVVKKDGTDDEYVIPQDLLIGIYGKNFTVYRYVYNEQTRASFPIVSFGDIELNKNKKDSIQLYVMDDNGNIMDGTPGNETGSKILAVIPAETVVPKEYIDTNVPVIVTNPVRNSSSPGLSSEDSVMVRFTLVKEDKIPVIESVTPDVVTVDGGETVTIKGSNFYKM